MLLEKLNVKLGLGTETVKMVVKSKKKQSGDIINTNTSMMFLSSL